MAEILQFPPAVERPRRPGHMRGESAIVIFPGVRYEREADSKAEAAAKPARKPAVKRAKKSIR